MSNCPNCGKPLIVSGGKCVNCGYSLKGSISQTNNNRGERILNSRNVVGKESVWLLFLRYVLFALLVVEAVPISIAEFNGDNGIWWGLAVILFNFYQCGLAMWITIYANQGVFSHEEPFLQYFKWWHYIGEAIWILVGYFVFCHSEVLWMLITYLVLSFIYWGLIYTKFESLDSETK